MISEAKALNNSTPVKVIDSVNFEQEVYLHNEHGSAVYLGGSNVTTGTGFELSNNGSVTMKIPQDNELFAISSSGSGNLHVVRPD
tara:strand:- start:350 stop:604 length:255 start_codon:yes stop_codon:yes gene_type:complete